MPAQMLIPTTNQLNQTLNASSLGSNFRQQKSNKRSQSMIFEGEVGIHHKQDLSQASLNQTPQMILMQNSNFKTAIQPSEDYPSEQKTEDMQFISQPVSRSALDKPNQGSGISRQKMMMNQTFDHISLMQQQQRAGSVPVSSNPTPVSKLNIKKNQIKLKNDIPSKSPSLASRENRLKVKIQQQQQHRNESMDSNSTPQDP